MVMLNFFKKNLYYVVYVFIYLYILHLSFCLAFFILLIISNILVDSKTPFPKIFFLCSLALDPINNSFLGYHLSIICIFNIIFYQINQILALKTYKNFVKFMCLSIASIGINRYFFIKENTNSLTPYNIELFNMVVYYLIYIYKNQRLLQKLKQSVP